MSLEGGTTTPLRCPSCGSRLVEVERADVLVDACPECRGVWLDRGELDKILVRERRMAHGGDDDDDFLREVEGRGRAQQPPPRTQDRWEEDRPSRGDDPRRKKRKRSLLEDLLDF